jgi:hypothetical protein
VGDAVRRQQSALPEMHMRRTFLVLPFLVVACSRDLPRATEPPTGLTGVDADVASIKGEFSLAISPAAMEIERGATASAAIAIPRSKNFKKPVTLTLGPLPDGVSATITPPETDGDAAAVTFIVSPTALLGTATVMITGTANGREPLTVSVELTIVRPLIPITLDFCASDAPLFFAYQNDGEEWTQVVPDANASVFFKATERLAIAFTRGRRGPTGLPIPSVITSVMYVTADDLQPLNRVTCRSEFGNKAINGAFTGLSNGDGGAISMHLIPFTVNSFSPTFRATRKPDVGALDLIASRRVAGEPVSFIVRRGLDVPHDGSVAPLDFGSSEAVPVEMHPYSVTGLRGVNEIMSVDFWTDATRGGMPSYQQLLSRFTTGVPALGTFRAAPASLLVPGDRHELTFRTGFNAEYAGVTSVFRNATPQTLAIGPALNVPAFEAIAGSAMPRFRATVASQTEYGAAVRLVATQSNMFTVEATAAYHAGTPLSWTLEIPDLSTVTGWDGAWNFLAGQSTVLELSAWSTAAVDFPALWINTAIPPWPRPFADGTIVNFAGRRLSVVAQ